MDTKKDAAQKEYYFLQNEVGRYDQISHGIKNWSITVSFALIAAGFYQESSELFLISSVGALLFWLTESRWKRYQRIHIERIKEIECFLLEETSEYHGPSINRSFKKRLGSRWERLFQELKTMRLSNVSMPHNLVLIIGLVLFALSKIGYIEITLPT